MLAGHITAFDQNKVDLNLFDSAVAVEGAIITQPSGGKLQARKTKLGGMLKSTKHTLRHARTHSLTQPLTSLCVLSSQEPLSSLKCMAERAALGSGLEGEIASLHLGGGTFSLEQI